MTAPDLRGMLLRSTAAEFGLAPTEEFPHVWAGMMELSFPQATASLVVVADGATSLYFSTGGGIIGGHGHEQVRAANRALLQALEKFYEAKAFVPRTEALAVLSGAVSFVVKTYDGMAVARDEQARMESKKSPLWPLFYLGHAVITALRETTEQRPGA